MERNLTQKKLASDLGIPLSTVHGWLNGVLPKSITDLKKIALYLEISIDELCFGEELEISKKEKVLGKMGNVELILREIK